MPDLRDEFEAWNSKYGEYRRSDAYEREDDGSYVEWPVERDWRTWQAATERVAKKEREESKEIEAVLKAILAESCDSEAESLVSMALYRRGHAAIRAREGKGGAG